jgi:agmatine/peptidylarginine deiminase
MNAGGINELAARAVMWAAQGATKPETDGSTDHLVVH